MCVDELLAFDFMRGSII